MKLHSFPAAVLLLSFVASHAASAHELRRAYLVRLADKPVASYTGGVSGLRATQPVSGKTIDLNAPEVQIYSAYLDQRRMQVRAAVATAPVTYEYKVVFNGFAAMLTDAEVAQLKATSGVAAIHADTPRHMLTSYTPTFLGLDQPGGLWSQLGGKEHAGEDIIIGVLDGGIWPENPSYADRVDNNGAPTFSGGQPAYGSPPPSWKGVCQAGEGFDISTCNNKLIGAQFFDADFQANGQVLHWTDFRSPRDSVGGNVGHGGHGTHTSTTAGGNSGVASSVNGIPMGTTSGIAPRARIAMYKICWTADDGSAPGINGCFTGDSVAAIEKAVQDGVHVLNYSISGGETIDDPVEQAFLSASNAGVFVAAAAGNSGPAVSINHVSPWLSTVAASTHDRLLAATLTLASGAKFVGASLNVDLLPNSPLVRAEEAAVAGADAAKVQLCYNAAANGGKSVLDPAKVAGKIVTCTRGQIDRVAKSLAVKEAGGVGMVLVDDGNGVVADVHSVPTVHLSVDDGHLVQAYAQKPDAQGAISKFAAVKGQASAPVVAAFSSRGPNAADPNLLKPEMAAPGVDILAGVTPGLTPDQRNGIAAGSFVPPPAWAFYQGTSMATPHVAGLAALLRQQHALWTPAAIKSALMTTGAGTLPDKLAGDAAGILPWGQGAGQVTPNRAADPGLVYDATLADYRKYMCGAGMNEECGTGSINGYDLNTASITLNNVMGSVPVKRSVTNVGTTAATYTVKASMSGYSVQVSPTTLTLAPGETGSFVVTFKRGPTSGAQWEYGFLEWNDNTHVVRIPMQARSIMPLVAAPAQLQADRASGMRLMSVATGFAGKLLAVQGGLKEMSRTSLSVDQAPYGTADTLVQATAACKAGAPGVTVVPVTIPADTLAARFELVDRDVEGGATGQQDIDLVVLNGGTLIDYSMHVGSNESITLGSPPAGTYQVCVIGYDLAAGAPAGFVLSSAIVSRNDVGGALKVALPSKVYAGSTATVGLSWSGLASGKRYVGGVRLTDQNGDGAVTTVLSIGTDGAPPVNAMAQRVVRPMSSL